MRRLAIAALALLAVGMAYAELSGHGYMGTDTPKFWGSN